MSYNTAALNRFASGIADIQLERNPLAQEVMVIFNEVIRDHYQDAVSSEECRIKKRAMVKKDVDMDYVQQEIGLLMEDSEQLPWIVSITTTNLPRVPRLDDQVLIEGLRYNVSYVRPSNRSIDSIILLYVYPERNDADDLKIYSVSNLGDGYMDIVYGGCPVEMAFSSDAIRNESLRMKFNSRPAIPPGMNSGVLVIFDANGAYYSLNYDI